MAQTVESALKAAQFYSDDEPYILIRLPPAAITVAAGIIAEVSDPFCALVVDKDEVTLIVPHEVPDEFGQRLRNHEIAASRYRLITIDVELEPTLVGFMARVSEALASAGISILPVAAYTRDHLLVPEQQFEQAIAVLKQLQANL